MERSGQSRRSDGARSCGRGGGSFPGLRRGRPLRFGGAVRRDSRPSASARSHSGRVHSESAIQSPSTWFDGMSRRRRRALPITLPGVPPLGLRACDGSSRVREGFPRRGPRAAPTLTVVQSREPIRSPPPTLTLIRGQGSRSNRSTGARPRSPHATGLRTASSLHLDREVFNRIFAAVIFFRATRHRATLRHSPTARRRSS